jgi:hypothetical protein
VASRAESRWPFAVAGGVKGGVAWQRRAVVAGRRARAAAEAVDAASATSTPEAG